MIKSEPDQDHSRSNSSNPMTPTSEERFSFNNSPGRLKFFKDGRCLLELTHKEVQSGMEVWESGNPKNVFWPPSETVKTEGSITIPVKAAAIVENGIIKGPPRIKRPFKGLPKHFDLAKQPPQVIDALTFSLRTFLHIQNNRRKIRNLKRKCRQPYSEIFVGAVLLQLERNSVDRPKRPQENDRIKKSSRLESHIARLLSRPKHKKPVISIQPWNGGGGIHAVKPAAEKKRKPTQAVSSPGRVKVKSELFQIMEKSSQDDIVTSSPVVKGKTLKPWIPLSSPKMLPITPTKAVVKHTGSPKANVTSLVMSEKQKIKLEVGRQNLPIPQHLTSSSSPTTKLKNHSPYKDLMMRGGFSPDLQRVRQEIASSQLRSPHSMQSVDLRQRESPTNSHMHLKLDRESLPGDLMLTYGKLDFEQLQFLSSSSPFSPDVQRVRNDLLLGRDNRSPLNHLPPSPTNNSSFSRQPKRLLDEFESPNAKRHRLSIELKNNKDGGGPGAMDTSQKPKTSTLFSIDSIIMTDSKPSGEYPRMVTPSRPHLPKVVVPITPYSQRQIEPSSFLDPRMANLAGIAASPLLGLNQIDYMMNPFLAPYLSAAAAAAAASHSASSSSMGSSMWQPSDRESVPSVASNHGAFTPTPSPPVTQTSKNHIREDQRYEHSGSEEQGANGGDAPLNLSLRR